MSYDIHIIRGSESDNPEDQISAAEWIAYIESDPGLQRIVSQNAAFIQAKLSSASADADEGQVLSWCGGSISASFPKKPVLAKMSQIAKYFDADVISDDGDVWRISEEGDVRVD